MKTQLLAVSGTNMDVESYKESAENLQLNNWHHVLRCTVARCLSSRSPSHPHWICDTCKCQIILLCNRGTCV